MIHDAKRNCANKCNFVMEFKFNLHCFNDWNGKCLSPHTPVVGVCGFKCQYERTLTMKKRVEQGKLFKRFFASYCLIIVIVLLITLVIFTTTSATMTSYILDSCTGMLKQSAEALDAFFLRLSNTASRMAIDSSLSKGYMNLNEYNAVFYVRLLFL